MRNGDLCALNLYISAGDCGLRCADDLMSFFLYVGERVEPPSSMFDGFVGLGYVIVADSLGAVDFNQTKALVWAGMGLYALEIIDDFT